jgi:methionyl-tRNA formyltransferase
MAKTSKTTKNSGNSVVFFGSGPVAAKSLELLTKNFEIEAIITKPRAPHHKGDVPVLRLAEELEITTFTPSNKQELSELFATNPVTSKLGIVIDYGIIINRDVIDYFPLGIVNSHFSLLPEWRGADPITFAILSGQKQTGVSLMLINEKMDEGELLAQAPYDISINMTTPELTDALIDVSDTTLSEILPLYFAGNVVTQPQPNEVKPMYSRKLIKDDGLLDWTKPAVQLEREVRAYAEWPKSRTQLAGKDITITKSHTVNTQGKPGAISVEGKQIIVACGKDSLSIDELKPAGKNKMTSEAFLAGHKNLL